MFLKKMNLRKHLFVTLMAVCLFVLSAFFCTGCGKRPKLIVLTEATFPPYEYVDKDGAITGIDIEVVRRIGNELGYDIEVQDTSFDYVLEAVKKGEADIAASGLTITLPRKETVDFSVPYNTTKQVIIVLQRSSIKSSGDLKGKSIGVQRDSTGDQYVTEKIQEPERFANGELAISALVSGK